MIYTYTFSFNLLTNQIFICKLKIEVYTYTFSFNLLTNQIFICKLKIEVEIESKALQPLMSVSTAPKRDIGKKKF
jgi:hypothetical protein